MPRPMPPDRIPRDIVLLPLCVPPMNLSVKVCKASAFGADSTFEIAPLLHTAIHAPHSMHNSGSITAFRRRSSIRIADTGHSFTHNPHPVHLSASIITAIYASPCSRHRICHKPSACWAAGSDPWFCTRGQSPGCAFYALSFLAVDADSRAFILSLIKSACSFSICSSASAEFS